MIKVLFVCVHNSARSQMAEAFLNKFGQGRIVAESAGLQPGMLNEDVVASMKEIGFDISGNMTKSVFDFYKEGRRYHYVIKVCDQINGQRCPIFPATKEIINWNHEDPSSYEGNKEERLRQVAEIREEIRANVLDFVQYHLMDELEFSTSQHEQLTLKEKLNEIYSTSQTYGASTQLFKENERVLFGHSAVSATNAILLSMAVEIKKALNVSELPESSIRSIMDSFWYRLSPVKQGRVSLETFEQGILDFAAIKHVPMSTKSVSLDNDSTLEYRNSIMDAVKASLNKNQFVIFNQYFQNVHHVDVSQFALIVAMDDEFTLLDNGKLVTFDLETWLNDRSAIGGFIFVDM